MRAKTASDLNRRGAWDRALEGDPEALKSIEAWLARDGIYVQGTLFVRPGHITRERFCRAVYMLSRVNLNGRFGIEPHHIIRARFSDFERLELNGSFGVSWRVHNRNGSLPETCTLLGRELEAWKTVAKYGRASAPDGDDKLLAPRRSGRRWDIRGIRNAIRKGETLERTANANTGKRPNPLEVRL